MVINDLNKNGVLSCSGILTSTGKIVVTHTELHLSDAGGQVLVNSSSDINYTADIDNCIKLYADKQYIDYPQTGEYLTAQKIINYTLESVDMDGEGRIKQLTPACYVIPATYGYDYYLKDHLGSTRMVINETDDITESVTYYPYGKMYDKNGMVVQTPEKPSREKFTGKELDNEGVLFSEFKFDINVTEVDLALSSLDVSAQLVVTYHIQKLTRCLLIPKTGNVL